MKRPQAIALAERAEEGEQQLPRTDFIARTDFIGSRKSEFMRYYGNN